jgi:hypothetical protein
MVDRRIFLKNRRASSFNKDLSNEPNFGRIHLAGHYLKAAQNHFLNFKVPVSFKKICDIEKNNQTYRLRPLMTSLPCH